MNSMLCWINPWAPPPVPGKSLLKLRINKGGPTMGVDGEDVHLSLGKCAAKHIGTYSATATLLLAV